LGNQGTGKSFLSGLLVDDNEDVVDVGTWEETEHGALLRASTDWIEFRDGHGLETFEPARNVEIVDLPGYEHSDDVGVFTSLVNIPLTRAGPRARPVAFNDDPSSLLYDLRNS
jgi:hypothetical protein